MADTATASNRFRKIEPGTLPNTWGTPLNEDAGSDRVDEALDAVVSFTLSGSKALTSTNYETDEARKRTIYITGGTGGTVTIPAVPKWYNVRNGASGNVTFDNGSNTVTVVPNEKTEVVTDGTLIWKNDAREYTDSAILNASLSATLPSQSGNAGKALSTDGTNASWGFVSLTAGVTGTLPVANGGTGITALGTGVATALGINIGSAGALLTFNGALGTPSSGTLTNCTGLPLASGISGMGSGVITALGNAAGASGGVVTVGGALGTPASGDLSNCTGGGPTLGANVGTFLATPSSANLAAAVTDETGSGALVFGTSPTFTTNISVPNGTEGTPGIRFSSDTDTGIYRGGTNYLVIACGGTGTLGVGQGTVNVLSGNDFRLFSPTNVPASASATGVAGTITWDANYIYVCTATDTWKRVAIATW